MYNEDKIDVTLWYTNSYYCGDCDNSWDDEWSCGCDDECSVCNVDYTPYSSEPAYYVTKSGDIISIKQVEKAPNDYNILGHA